MKKPNCNLSTNKSKKIFSFLFLVLILLLKNEILYFLGVFYNGYSNREINFSVIIFKLVIFSILSIIITFAKSNITYFNYTRQSPNSLHLKKAMLDMEIARALAEQKLEKPTYNTNTYVQNNNIAISKELSAINPFFDFTAFIALAKEMFKLLFENPTFFIEQNPNIDIDLKNRILESGFERFRIFQYNINDFKMAYLNDYARTPEYEILTALIMPELPFKNENNTAIRYLVKFRRASTFNDPKTGGFTSMECPNCNAPVNVSLKAVCPYCNAVIEREEYDWHLYDIIPMVDDIVD